MVIHEYILSKRHVTSLESVEKISGDFRAAVHVLQELKSRGSRFPNQKASGVNKSSMRSHFTRNASSVLSIC